MIDPQSQHLEPEAGAGRYTVGSSGRLSDPLATASERTYVTFIHLMPIFATAFPLFLVLGPLVMWLIRKNESAYINDHGREALNFNISLLIYYVVSGVLVLILVGFPLLIGVYVLGVVCSVLGAIAGNRGEFYRYPMCIRLIA